MGTTLSGLGASLCHRGLGSLPEDVLARQICSQGSIYDTNHLFFHGRNLTTECMGQELGLLASFFEDFPTSHWKTEMVRMHPLDAVLPRTPFALDSTPAIFCSSSENSSAQLPHCCVCQEAPPACPLHAWEEPGLSHSNRNFRQPPPFLTLNCQCALLPRNLLKTPFVVAGSSPLL